MGVQTTAAVSLDSEALENGKTALEGIHANLQQISGSLSDLTTLTQAGENMEQLKQGAENVSE